MSVHASTVIPYCYIDASNYKQCDEIVLRGELSNAEREAITSTLVDKSMFIPFDLRLPIPELQPRMEGFPSSDDHVFHLLGLQALREQALAPDKAAIIEKDDFVRAFARVNTPQGWNVLAAVMRLGL